MMNHEVKHRLERDEDRVFLCPADGGPRVPVTLVWVRPISGRGGQVSFVDADKKEVLMLDTLDDLDPESRRIAEEELRRRYLVPRIVRVINATANFGIRYWHVETDLGERHFALKNAARKAIWLSDDHLVLRDTMGCRYEIPSFAALDQRSRNRIERVL